MKSSSIEIFGKPIGRGHPTFIIAEAGSNHNGDLEIAEKLIDAAAEARADAVKFQTFRAEKLYSRRAGVSRYLRNEKPIYEIIEAMEMPPEWLPSLRDHAHSLGLAFLSSPFHEEAVDALVPYVDALKIASYELTHAPLLETVAKRGLPVILSTGASDLDEVRRAVAILRDNGPADPVVLQCTAAYPAPLEAANVRAIQSLADELDVIAGLSDHTRDPTAAPMAATALGAAVIEKHFTLSNRLPGPDHAFAVEPEELARLVQGVRRTELVLGTGEKAVQRVEDELRQFARRSIFATRPIRKGEHFTRDNIDVLRHGELETGLAPSELDRVLKSLAASDIGADRALQETDLADDA